MERNITFACDQAKSVRAKLTWAQIEIVTGGPDEFQIMIAGDGDSVEELRVELTGDGVIIAQPQLAYAKEILPRNRWLQICLRLPSIWRGDLDVDTIAGMVAARKIEAGSISLTTVNGALGARGIVAAELALHTVTGSINGEGLQAGRASLRGVSGRMEIRDASLKATKVFTVSGSVHLSLNQGAKTLDIQSISGSVCVDVEGPARASLHSLAGQFLLGEEVSQAEGGLEINASSVTGDLAVKGRA